MSTHNKAGIKHSTALLQLQGMLEDCAVAPAMIKGK